MVATVGEFPERSNGADCKSVGSAFEGSNPPLPKQGLSCGKALVVSREDSKGSARRPAGGKAATDGGGRAEPRPGGPRQEVEGRRANPPLPKPPNSLQDKELGGSCLRTGIELRGIVLLSCFYFLEYCHAPSANAFVYAQKERFKDLPVLD